LNSLPCDDTQGNRQHARLVGGDLGERRARHRGERHVVMLEVRQRAVEMIGQERAAWAARRPARAEHEMIDDELAAAGEQVGQGPAPMRRIERVALLDPHPRQREPLRVHLVAQAHRLLLLGEQCAAGGEPFGLGHHRPRDVRTIEHVVPPSCFAAVGAAPRRLDMKR